jgi:cation transporter-like permease
LKAKTMSQPASNPSPRQSASSPASGKRLTIAAFFTAIGAIVLIASEIWLGALATIWAADGVLGLSTTGDIILAAIIAPVALWATWMTVKLAVSAEMDPDNAA